MATHPPQLRASGFRAEGDRLDAGHSLVTGLAAAHEAAHGSPPRTFALESTTDARLCRNEFGVPAVADGRAVRNIHGTDEAVELGQHRGRGHAPWPGSWLATTPAAA